MSRTTRNFRLVFYFALSLLLLGLSSCSSNSSTAPQPKSKTDKIELSASFSPSPSDELGNAVIKVKYTDATGEVQTQDITLGSKPLSVDAQKSSVLLNMTPAFDFHGKHFQLTSQNSSVHVPDSDAPIAVSYVYKEQSSPASSLARGVLVYFNKDDIQLAGGVTGFAKQLAALIKKLGNVGYIYLDGFELVNASTANTQTYEFDGKTSKAYTKCTASVFRGVSGGFNNDASYKTIVDTVRAQLPDIHILLMSSLMAVQNCNMPTVDPTTAAKNLFSHAQNIGADGIAVDYEPIAVNESYESYTPHVGPNGVPITSFKDFVLKVYNPWQSNNKDYLSSLRDRAYQLKGGHGLFVVIAGKSGFYSQQLSDSSQEWGFGPTFIVSDTLENCANQKCSASLMYYDTGGYDLNSLIAGMTTAFNDGDAGLPRVLSDYHIPFRVTLPLSYSETNYLSEQENLKGYNYAAFLCDVSSSIGVKWALNALQNTYQQVLQQCQTGYTYLPDTDGKGIDGRTLLKGPVSIKSSWQTMPKLTGYFKSFTGLDFYRVVTKNYAKSTAGKNQLAERQYICDKNADSTSPDSLYACQSDLVPSIQSINQYFLSS